MHLHALKLKIHESVMFCLATLVQPYEVALVL